MNNPWLMGALAAQDQYNPEEGAYQADLRAAEQPSLTPRLDPGIRRVPGDTQMRPAAETFGQVVGDLVIPQDPLDYAAMFALGPLGKTVSKGARAGALAMGGVLGLSDEAEASRLASLRAAVRAGGRVYKAPPGGTHMDALSAVPENLRQQATLDADTRGFVNDRGRFMDRFKAQDYAKEWGLFDPKAPSWARTSQELIADNLKKYGLSAATPIGALAASAALPGEAEAGPLKNIVKGIKAYHSSPHDFEKFDASKIGTGEGAQVYGHGLYFAENPKVSGQGGEYWNQFLNKFSGPEMRTAEFLKQHGFDREAAIAELKRQYADPKIQGKAQIQTKLDLLGDNVPVGPRTYEVNIRADPAQMLDWDRPLGEQSEQVRSIYQRLTGARDPAEAQAKVRELQARMDELAADRDPRTNVMRGEREWTKLANERDKMWEEWKSAQTGGSLYSRAIQQHYPRLPSKDARARASESLAEAGIPGIKYLDQGSRFNQALYNDNPIANEARKFIEAAGGNSEKAAKLFYESSPVSRWATTERDEIRRLIQMASDKPTSNYVVFDPSIVDILKKYGIAGAAAPIGALAAQDEYR